MRRDRRERRPKPKPKPRCQHKRKKELSVTPSVMSGYVDVHCQCVDCQHMWSEVRAAETTPQGHLKPEPEKQDEEPL